LSFSFENKCKPRHHIYCVVFISIAGRTKLELQKHIIFYCGVIKKIRSVRIKKESQMTTLCFGTCLKFLTGQKYVALQSKPIRSNYVCTVLSGATFPSGSGPSNCRGFKIILRYTTLDVTPLYE